MELKIIRYGTDHFHKLSSHGSICLRKGKELVWIWIGGILGVLCGGELHSSVISRFLCVPLRPVKCYMALSTPPQKRLGYRDESYPASCLQPRGYYGLIFSGTELDSHSECTSILRHRRTIQDCPIRYPILLNIAWAMVNSLFKSTFANDPQSSLLPSGTRSTMPLMLHWSRIHR